MTSQSIDQFQAADALLKYVYSGAIGPTKGFGVHYAVMNTTDRLFTFSVALEPLEKAPPFLDRYQISIDRYNKELSTPEKIEINDEEMQKAVLAATGYNVATSCRFIDGGFSTSYKVTVLESSDIAYVVQLRFHGDVASMDAIMNFVKANSPPGAILMPAIYPIPNEARHQKTTGFGRQIADFVPGVIAEKVYSDMSHADRLEFVRSMAFAWQACWELPLPSPPQIGELKVQEDKEGQFKVTIGPDRHYSLGGPFKSVREWLKGRVQSGVSSLQRASGIDHYKDEYMDRIQKFVDTQLHQIPETMGNCPVVALHADMGLHNIIVSESNHKDIQAIIDWELCASAPFVAPYTCLDMMFRQGAPNGFGFEYLHADELRSAFWDAIPRWKAHWESQGTRDLLEWYRFALFLRPQYCSKEKSKEEKLEFWAENIRVVEYMLAKYGSGW